MKRRCFNIILLTILSCTENEDNGSPEFPAMLPTTIVLKEIPAGTFIMGGATIQNDAPEVSITCLLYTSPSPRDRTRSRMPSSA